MGITTQDIEVLLKEREQAFSSFIVNARIQQLVMAAAEKILHCISCGGKVITAGNGGSASQAQHFVSELMGKMYVRRIPIAAISLASDPSLLTCIGNDFGYERVFSRQIAGIGSSHDVFVAFTTSGKSRNILEALQTCQEQGIYSIVITGSHKNQCDCDMCIEVPSTNVAIIQELQLTVSHILCGIVDKEITTAGAGNHVWQELISMADKGYRYLILDRDGVVNKIMPNGYISNYRDFVFTEGFIRHIADLSRLYDRIFIVTNQRGVGLGLMTAKEMNSIHDMMLADIKKAGGHIDHVYVSTGTDSYDQMRKPNTGMANCIIQDYPDVDFSKAVVVGDSFSDKLFADRLNIKYVSVGNG